MLKHRLMLPEQIRDAYERVRDYLPDSLKNINAFVGLFLQKDSLFIELGDYQGMLWFTNLIPGWKANVHVVLWDEKLHGRSDEAREILNFYRRFLRLRRLSAYVPDRPEYANAVRYCEKIGFRYEGLLKYVDQYDEQLTDIHSYVLIEEN